MTPSSCYVIDALALKSIDRNVLLVFFISFLKLVGTHCSIFNIFLDNQKKIGIDVNTQDNHGYTPLHCCACRSSSVSKYVCSSRNERISRIFNEKNLKKIVINMTFEKHFYRCSLVCSKLHRCLRSISPTV